MIARGNFGKIPEPPALKNPGPEPQDSRPESQNPRT